MRGFKPALHEWELCEVLDEIWRAARTDKGSARQLLRLFLKKVGSEFDVVTRSGVKRMKLNRRALASLIR